MNFPRKIIIFIVLSIISIFILAISLSNLSFSPGKPFSLDMDGYQMPSGFKPLPGSDLVYNIFRALYFTGWAIFFIGLIYMLLTKEGRKRLLLTMLRLIPFLLIGFLLIRAFQKYMTNIPEPTPIAEQIVELNPGQTYPIPGGEEYIPSTPSWGVWLASLGLSLLIIGIIGIFGWIYYKNKQRNTPYRSLAQEAQQALNAIEQGGDLRNIVIRCYYEMSKILSEEKGILRFPEMTPHEFQMKLVEKGIPGNPIQQITSLFEEVRYGTKSVGRLEEQRAITSLSAIVDFCKVKR